MSTTTYKYASFTADEKRFYGVRTDDGMIALSPNFPDWPTLRAEAMRAAEALTV